MSSSCQLPKGCACRVWPRASYDGEASEGWAARRSQPCSRYRSPSRCRRTNRLGESPINARKSEMRWLWSEKPRAAARSDHSTSCVGDNSSSTLRRRMTRWACLGEQPTCPTKRRWRWRLLIPRPLASSPTEGAPSCIRTNAEWSSWEEPARCPLAWWRTASKSCSQRIRSSGSRESAAASSFALSPQNASRGAVRFVTSAAEAPTMAPNDAGASWRPVMRRPPWPWGVWTGRRVGPDTKSLPAPSLPGWASQRWGARWGRRHSSYDARSEVASSPEYARSTIPSSAKGWTTNRTASAPIAPPSRSLQS